MKRLLSALLACALLSASACAHASERLIRDALYGYSHIINTHVNTESTSNTTRRSLTLEAGDYVIVSPVHAVNTNYLSYDLPEVECSDPAVVEAGFYRQSDGRLGLRLRGKAPGSAVVTATYSTYPTRAGLNYEDKRANATFTQTLDVTVVAQGGVDVSVSVSGGEYSAVRGVAFQMTPPEGALAVPDGAFSGYAGSGESADGAADAGDRAPVRALLALMNRAQRVARDLREAGRRTQTASPACYPGDLRLSVTVTNDTPDAISGVALRAEGNRYVSFCGETGPWGASSALCRDALIPAGESRTFGATIRLRPDEGAASPDGAPVLACAADIEVVCEYAFAGAEAANAVTRRVSLPVYTAVTDEQLLEYRRAIRRQYGAWDGDPGALLRHGDGARLNQVFAFEGPVTLTLYGASGEPLAEIAREGDAFSDGVACAFRLDGMLCAVVPADALYDYAVSLRAARAGSLRAVTYGYAGAQGARFRTYDAVPLSGGDAFGLLAYPEDAAELCREDGVGALAPVAADGSLGQAELVAALASRSLSDAETKALAGLMLRGLAPEALPDDGTVDREGLCALMANVAGEFFDAAGEDAAARLEALGLSVTPADESRVTVGEALALADGLLARLGLADAQTDWPIAPLESWPESEWPEELEREGPGLCGSFGLDRDLDREAALTAGQAALLADRVLDYAGLALRRAALVERIADAYENSLGWYDDYSNLCLYAMSPEDAQTLLGDAILWFPTANGREALYRGPGYLAAATLAYVSVVTGNDAAYAAVRSGEADRDLAVCAEMGGAFSGTGGVVYRWVPFCLMDGNGQIRQDAVYLAVVEIDAGAAEDYVIARDVNEYAGDYTAKYFLIADQALAAAFLGAFAPLTPPEEPEKLYEALAEGDRGDGVQALQARLIELGYLEGEADGSYGERTSVAVAAFQAENGLEATGAADADTQALLFREVRTLPVFQDWVARHSAGGDAAAVVKALDRREANAEADALRRAVAGEGLLHAREARVRTGAGASGSGAETSAGIPEALAERCGGMPEAIDALEARYGVSELASVYGEWAPESIAAELQYVGDIVRPRLAWSFVGGSFDYTLSDGESVALDVACRENGDSLALSVAHDFDPEAVGYCAYALEFASGGQTRAIRGDANEAAVLAEETFEAEGYTDCRYTVAYHGGYYVVSLTATDGAGEERGWSAYYDEAGRLVDRYGSAE